MIAGIGIDIVDIDRMALAISRRPNIVKKILTDSELKDLGLLSVAVFSDSDIASIAARFACKEATVKSIDSSLFEIGLQSIEVLRNEVTGAPKLSVSSIKAQGLSFLCSITHSDKSAAAVVIAQSSSSPSS